MSAEHFTTRRAFVATAGFGVVSLYLLWAGYGAAPLAVGRHEGTEPDTSGGHGGEHGAAPSGRSTDEFRRLTHAFVEEHKLPDGSVEPRRATRASARATEEHSAHGAEAMKDHAMPESEHAAAIEPIDVYLMAYQWGYSPAVLRLEAGVPYRFRMMAVDVTHGASIQLGRGGRMIRLRPNVLVEQEITFAQPGEYLVYCSVYCGLPHDRMQAKIVVTPAVNRT